MHVGRASDVEARYPSSMLARTIKKKKQLETMPLGPKAIIATAPLLKDG